VAGVMKKEKQKGKGKKERKGKYLCTCVPVTHPLNLKSKTSRVEFCAVSRARNQDFFHRCIFLCFSPLHISLSKTYLGAGWFINLTFLYPARDCCLSNSEPFYYL